MLCDLLPDWQAVRECGSDRGSVFITLAPPLSPRGRVLREPMGLFRSNPDQRKPLIDAVERQRHLALRRHGLFAAKQRPERPWARRRGCFYPGRSTTSHISIAR
jgi:hypothetical protein